MNIFILNSGRVGSTTFVRACEHITNYSAAHESRWGRLGADRLDYPPDHIEADNRLSWYLGRLDRTYGDDAFYVHLRRDEAATASSFVARRETGIMRAYRRVIVRGLPAGTDTEAIALDYLETVDANIELFLRDKPRKMDFQLEDAAVDFGAFWAHIGAEGDLGAATAEFDVSHNATGDRPLQPRTTRPRARMQRRVRRLGRVLRGPDQGSGGQ